MRMTATFGLLLALAGSASARERGHNVPKQDLRTVPLPRPSGRLHVITQWHEEVKVNLYRRDGSFDQAALAQLDWVCRDRRRDQARALDPRLFEVASIIQDHFEGKPILLVSAYRVERESSRHRHASAIDFHVEGVSYHELYEFARTLDPGGMGIGRYPRGGYVHLDFRAPSEPSYTWIDSGGSGKKHKKHKKLKKHPPRTPAA